MSQHVVGIVMDRLLTDESLRLRFAIDRVEALCELHAHGFELRSSEIDLFVASNI